MSAPIISKPGFVDPSFCPIVSSGRQRLYRTPVGNLPSVTTILKVLGLSTEALISWSARVEREAILQACADVYAEAEHRDWGPADFSAAVEQRIGKAKASQRIKEKAGDIGTSIHQAVQHRMQTLLGEAVGPPPQLEEQALWSFMKWEDWWKDSGLRPFRAEQPVWDETLGYAGTIDLLAYDEAGRLGILDLKTGKGVYDDHHLQVTAYMKAARNFADVEWAKIICVPKSMTDTHFIVKDLGEMYDRRLTEEQLMTAWTGAVMAWKVLLAKEAA